jgi:flagellar basal-body rod protein FlgB
MGVEGIFGKPGVALKVREARQEILANNLANSSTPGFKARDIDFQQALQQSAPQVNNTNLLTTNKNHISTGSISQSYRLQYRIPMQPRLDGNTVDPDIERAKFTENSLQYQASLGFVRSRTQSLMKAIKGE